MNKLKSIFCTAFLFIVCAVMCVGCSFGGNTDNDNGNNSNTSAEPTISLAEAEFIIMDVLALNNNNANRDLLEKLGKFRLSEDMEALDVDTDKIAARSHLNGLATYANNNFVNFFVENSRDEQHYLLNGVDYYLDEVGPYGIREGDGSVLNGLKIFNTILTQDSFDYILQRNVKKITTTDGFSLVLKSDLKGAMQTMWLFNNECPGAELDEKWNDFGYETKFKERYAQTVIDECKLSLQLNFDKEKNIIGADFEMVYLSLEPEDENAQAKVFMSIRKTEAEITQPQWVTDYLESKN